MKTILSTALLSLFCVAAVGCVDGPDDDLDLQAIDLRTDYEVIVVDAVDTRPEIADDGLEISPDVGDALVSRDRKPFIDGSGTKDGVGVGAPVDDGTFVGGADTIGEADDGISIVDGSLPGRLPPGAVEADSGETTSPCDCAGADCLEEWVETNLGCDVCAVFTCGEDHRPAACHACQ